LAGCTAVPRPPALPKASRDTAASRPSPVQDCAQTTRTPCRSSRKCWTGSDSPAGSRARTAVDGPAAVGMLCTTRPRGTPPPGWQLQGSYCSPPPRDRSPGCQCRTRRTLCRRAPPRRPPCWWPRTAHPAQGGQVAGDGLTMSGGGWPQNARRHARRGRSCGRCSCLLL
jgi:hypothetical protein